MFIFTELIEETGRPPGLIADMGIFLAWLDQVLVYENFSHILLTNDVIVTFLKL